MDDPRAPVIFLQQTGRQRSGGSIRNQAIHLEQTLAETMRSNGVEQRQPSRLRRSRAIATSMLALAAAVFAASLSVPNPATAILLLRAIAEPALVGGLGHSKNQLSHWLG